MSSDGERSLAAERRLLTQVAAIPWRPAHRGIEVLLVTSRTNARWMVPKGWPIAGLSDAESAAQEAYEEAGLKGQLSACPIGSYRYMKILKDGVSQRPSQAIAYGLRVTEVLDKWPEKGQRQRRWLQPLDAAALVAEPDLGRLLRAVAVGRLLF